MKYRFISYIFIVLLFGCERSEHNQSFKLFPQLAQTPPMGWNSWNWFGCDINETIVREVAEAIAHNGMKDAGYEYIVIDDCWAIERNTLGNLVADRKRFPSGIKDLSDFIHSLGLKFGIYTSIGPETCQGRPGSQSFEYQDAQQFAQWGVDYLKYDWCGVIPDPNNIIIMSAAIRSAGRPMVLSLSEWGQNDPWINLRDYVHMWRTSFDIGKCFENSINLSGTNLSWPQIIDMQDNLAKYAGPGNWNDPDMLQVGNTCMNFEENKAHFSLYSLVAAPLMAGNDVRKMAREDLSILTNLEVISINQDPLGIQGTKFKKEINMEIWTKELAGDEYAVVFFNKGDKESSIDLKLSEIGLSGNFLLRDVWLKEDIGITDSDTSIEPLVTSHGVVMYRVSKM